LQTDLKFLMQQNHGDHVHEWEEASDGRRYAVSLAQMRGPGGFAFVQELDGYLCELPAPRFGTACTFFRPGAEGST